MRREPDANPHLRPSPPAYGGQCRSPCRSDRRRIRKLRASGKFDGLSEDLRELATLREENPESSLKELGNMLSVSLSRSGVYHRLNKIVSLAEAED